MSDYPTPYDRDDYDEAGRYWGPEADEPRSAREDPEMYLDDGTFIGDLEFVLHPQPFSFWFPYSGGSMR